MSPKRACGRTYNSEGGVFPEKQQKTMPERNVAVILVYSANGRSVPVCRVDDLDIVAQAARAAITQAQERASALSDVDDVLGRTEKVEAQRLADTLSILVPDLTPRRIQRRVIT